MPLYNVKIIVSLKPEILDVQGRTVREAIRSFGNKDIKNARCGKYFELELESEDRDKASQVVDELCRKLLANPVIEQYKIEFGGTDV